MVGIRALRQHAEYRSTHPSPGALLMPKIDRDPLAPNAFIHARLASTTLSGDAVWTTRVMRHPACESSLRYSSAVRSLPARLSSISRSIHLPTKSRS
jgi:hypothetical protein